MSKEKKRKKRVGLKLLLILIVLVGLTYYVSKVDIVDNTSFEINSEVKYSDLVSKAIFTSIENRDELLDTKELGDKEITLILRTLLGNVNKTVKYTVVDTIAPELSLEDTIYVIQYSGIEGIKSATGLKDNSNQEIEFTISGEYNLEETGKYEIIVYAKDLSGNESQKAYDMIVEIVSKNGESATYFETPNGFKGYVKDGLTFVDGILIVNKTYSITADYFTSLSNEFMTNYYEMKTDMNNAGLSIWIQSGHRTNGFQSYLYSNSFNAYGKALADTKTARPRYSEHEAGLAADFNLVDQSFKNTAQYSWLQENCYKYGFVLRYPEGKTDETGYEFEPWHYRYVGKDLAKILWNNGNWLSIEGYFGLESKYID